ncbi:MAG TPA: ATP-binding protein [Vicinamibacterales bacterium]|nr:ATP-binding protein [Vicinamibacterales bacterium]
MRTEELRRQAETMEAVGRLAGGVAHDLNNVLTAIFGYVDLLADQFGPEDPRRADVEEIRLAAERASALTRQLLALGRRQTLQPRVLNLNELIAGLEQPLQRLVGDGVRITVRGAPDLWNARVDPDLIEQVLTNLCANARDAMPDGGRIVISTVNRTVADDDATGHAGLAPGSYVVLSVEDSGRGMPASVLRHVFEPFFTTKPRGKGTGLGLATVYGIVAQSGGATHVESEEGKGTRVLVYLPGDVK